MALMKWNQKNYDPFEEFSKLGDSIFGLTLFPQGRNLPVERSWYPAIDVSEEKDRIVVKADLPGMKQEDIDLTLDDDILTIRGERKSETEEKDKNVHRVERTCGAFERSLKLGANVDRDKITADYKNGVLEVAIPKTEESKPRQLKINVK